MNALALQSQPSLSQLNNLIKKIPAYPISIGSLLDFAKKNKQPKEVVDFYSSFGPDQVFDSPDDLKERSEQVEMMRQEEKDMPQEQMVAPEEY